MSKNGKKQASKKKVRAKTVAKNLQERANRERIRVAGEIVKLQRATASQSPVTPADLTPLYDHLNRLTEVHNRNSQAFGAGIQHLDARVGAMMLYLDDLARGVEVKREDGGVGWEHYLTLYIEQIKQVQDKAAAGEPTAPVAEDQDTGYNDVTFGGVDDVQISP